MIYNCTILLFISVVLLLFIHLSIYTEIIGGGCICYYVDGFYQVRNMSSRRVLRPETLFILEKERKNGSGTLVTALVSGTRSSILSFTQKRQMPSHSYGPSSPGLHRLQHVAPFHAHEEHFTLPICSNDSTTPTDKTRWHLYTIQNSMQLCSWYDSKSDYYL